jgi:hypothetical protein
MIFEAFKDVEKGTGRGVRESAGVSFAIGLPPEGGWPSYI